MCHLLCIDLLGADLSEYCIEESSFNIFLVPHASIESSFLQVLCQSETLEGLRHKFCFTIAVLKFNLHLVLEDFGPLRKGNLDLEEATIAFHGIMSMRNLLFIQKQALPGPETAQLFTAEHSGSYVRLFQFRALHCVLQGSEHLLLGLIIGP